MKTLDIVQRNIIQKDIFLEGIPVNVLDFGTVTKAKVLSRDTSLSEVQFDKREPSTMVLDKYGIDMVEYNNICNKLRDELQSYMF